MLRSAQYAGFGETTVHREATRGGCILTQNAAKYPEKLCFWKMEPLRSATLYKH